MKPVAVKRSCDKPKAPDGIRTWVARLWPEERSNEGNGATVLLTVVLQQCTGMQVAASREQTREIVPSPGEYRPSLRSRSAAIHVDKAAMFFHVPGLPPAVHIAPGAPPAAAFVNQILSP